MVRLRVTYMEQTGPPAGAPLAKPVAKVSVARETVDAENYLQLYRLIGIPLKWDERLRMPGAALAAFLVAPSTAVFILRVAGEALGLCEFEGVGATGDVELKHFGLVPEAQGRRLGPFLLDHALRSVWSGGARRVWLHTDTNDHPRAMAVYECAGFRAYREAWEEFAD